ncbi:MAG: inorganic pyrophosphatase, partial [Gammaproteobacteria bacterium]|nr:inorganic pyrophosphatase [Gammaproteobacteria bacterium]
EKEKWVRLDGWGDATEAKRLLVEAMERFQAR